ncbi:hypothetical protein RvY_08535-2 [Ramazzottius varieornatus]|uniref:Uncharacterized protein n=1 Tax=Ramazzottius varieornatus TaxID=947166 RepID=A0A1D1V695_RAMVA|nr:hypothetical protein RvY_08535-2 [Ramazzottius varieornatus]
MKQFNSTSRSFESVLFYSGASHRITQPFGRDLMWLSGRVPGNELRCGFDGMKAQCHTSNVGMLTTVVVFLTLLTLLTAFGSAILYWYHKYASGNFHGKMIFLMSTELIFSSEKGQGSS